MGKRDAPWNKPNKGVSEAAPASAPQAKRRRQDKPTRRSSRNSNTKTGGVLVNSNVKLGPGLGEEEGSASFMQQCEEEGFGLAIKV